MSMLSSEDKTLIERYFQNNLDENSMILFLKKLEENSSFFEEAVAWMLLHKRVLKRENELISSKKQKQHTLDFEKILSNVELDVYLEEEILKPIQQEEGFKEEDKIEDLLQKFRLVPAYERMMATVERGGNLIVLQPSNKMICHNRTLTFVLQQATTVDVFIRIENNQKRMLFTQQISSNLTTFTVELPEDVFSAGLYYWKLMDLEGMVMGSFLISQSSHTPPKT
ncbi:MAG: hypothetical protein ACPG49_12920 [Chitinophagales bacterium]